MSWYICWCYSLLVSCKQDFMTNILLIYIGCFAEFLFLFNSEGGPFIKINIAFDFLIIIVPPGFSGEGVSLSVAVMEESVPIGHFVDGQQSFQIGTDIDGINVHLFSGGFKCIRDG